MANEAPDVKSLELSRYCVPYTPFRGKIEEAHVCIVSTAGVRERNDRPFELEGDSTFRIISGAAKGTDLTFDDSHYDHGCADHDINCIFPIDRVRELVAEGKLGGLTERHFSLGFSQALRELREKTVPELARAVDKARPDVVLLTGG